MENYLLNTSSHLVDYLLNQFPSGHLFWYQFPPGILSFVTSSRLIAYFKSQFLYDKQKTKSALAWQTKTKSVPVCNFNPFHQFSCGNLSFKSNSCLEV